MTEMQRSRKGGKRFWWASRAPAREIVAILGRGPVGQAFHARLSELDRYAPVVGVAGKPLPSSGFTTAARAVLNAGIVIHALPFAIAEEVLAPLRLELAGKTLVDVTNPVGPGGVPLPLSPDGSNAERLASMLPETFVVKAFNTVSVADILCPKTETGEPITTFVASDAPERTLDVLVLARRLGFRAVAAGALGTAIYLETVSSLNIGLHIRSVRDNR